ncbi:MAG: hypothetical protein HFH85_20005 [Lachnospiraceae bacterium]|nr:hypothetical protein [Lachnospiraceae bacterium]
MNWTEPPCTRAQGRAWGFCHTRYLQDSTSESAATADTTLDITEIITATMIINKPPPKTININDVLLPLNKACGIFSLGINIPFKNYSILFQKSQL